MMPTQTKMTNFEILQDLAYRHMTLIPERWKGRLLFTDRGAMRLCHIAGWLLGLAHGGKFDEADKLADNLFRSLDSVVGTENIEYEIDNNGEKETIKAAARKCILSDDGCLHSFNLMWYVPIDPARFWEVVATFPDETYPHDMAKKKLNILERVNPNDHYSEELTQFRYACGCRHEVYYRPTHNGGLIYHGPGAGETLTVSLDSNSQHYWGVHT